MAHSKHLKANARACGLSDRMRRSGGGELGAAQHTFNDAGHEPRLWHPACNGTSSRPEEEGITLIKCMFIRCKKKSRQLNQDLSNLYIILLYIL